MRHKKQILAVLVTLFITISAVNAQEKYALMICGDYQPGTEIILNHTWNLGQDMDPDKGYDEFWNDTYLMWEMLFNHPTGYSNDNIKVLFAEGIDYTFQGQDDRYKSYPNYQIPSITDGAATKTNIMAALDNLANIKQEDYLFIWIMSNGGNVILPGDNNSSFIYLWDYDPAQPNAGRLYDYELKQKLDLIPAHKKVVVVQAPHSGYFANTLEDESTIVFTSSMLNQNASRANDTPYEENEEWGGDTYYHGEFGYHFYSPLNGKDPGNNNSYGPTSFSSANANNDDLVSIGEGIDWALAHNNANETPVVSDLGANDEITAVQYSTILMGQINSDIDFIGNVCLTGPPPVYPQSTSQVVALSGNINFKTANVYLLGDTRLYNLVNPGLFKIEKGVSIFGESISAIISYSNIEVGSDVTFSGIDDEPWGGGFAVTQHDLYLERITFIDCRAVFNQIPNLSIIDGTFIRSGLIGQALSQNTEIKDNTTFIHSYADLDGYGSGNLKIENSSAVGPSYDLSSNYGLKVRNFQNYEITGNIVQNYEHGIYLSNCSGPRYQRDIINNSIHGNTNAGIYVNRSYAYIFNNPGIYENNVGIQCVNYSNVDIEGNPEATHFTETQRIHDNDLNQLRASLYSFPYCKWNAIWNNYNTSPLVYWDLGNGDPAMADVTNNFWGPPEFFEPNEDLYPTNAIKWIPVWELDYGDPKFSDDETLYKSASEKVSLGDFTGAKNEYMFLVSTYPESMFAVASLKELLPLEKDVNNDYAALQIYYLTNPVIISNDRLYAVALNLANWCNVKMENYTSAIQYYNDILADPPSYHDSLFAIFDINYINTLIDEGGYKSMNVENIDFFDMTTKVQSDAFVSNFTNLLFPQQELSNKMKQNIAFLKSGELLQNVPNPFKGTTQIWYKLKNESKIQLNVYNYTGQLIRSIVEGSKTGGNHFVEFDATGLKNGIYFYSISINGQITDSKKMTIMK